MKQDATVAGTRTPYSAVISPRDQMWMISPAGYFDVGLSALDCIRRTLTGANGDPGSILDFPCGHGRVCRMLRAEFPGAHLVACDLDRDGVDFCAAQFGAEPVYSHPDIRQVELPRLFDLIWCGSLFTHLDRDRWAQFLEFFADCLAPDGLLIFTTHGRQALQLMHQGVLDYGLSEDERSAWIHDYAAHGFGFVSPGKQEFGLSLSSLAFVCAELESLPWLKVVGLYEAAWAGHHDVISCRRLQTPFPGPDPPV